MKAVLVIDMPSRCFGCKLHRVIYGENGNEFMAFCWLLRRPVNDLDERPSWCPLKPLPEGHGDLIDRKALIENGLRKGFCDLYDEIKMADAIIEADTGEAE